MIEKRLHHDSIKRMLDDWCVHSASYYGEFRIVKIKQVVNGYELRNYALFSRLQYKSEKWQSWKMMAISD